MSEVKPSSPFSGSSNRLVLTAGIAQAQPLRYTPAGLPALDLRLEHESVQADRGQNRQVKAKLKAQAFGTLAERLCRVPMDSKWRFEGFLSSSRNAESVVFQIQEFFPEPGMLSAVQTQPVAPPKE